MWYKKPYRRIKRNQCKAKGCYNPVWKEGYCYAHQYYVAAKKPIPKYKKRKVSKTESYGFRSQMELFQYVIYNAPRPIICPVSGRDITKLFEQDPSVWVSCCAHIIPKGRYPRWKLNPRNILLLDPEVHHLFDQGTEAQRQKTGWEWTELYNLQEQLKREYEEERKSEYGQGAVNDKAEVVPTQQAGAEDGREGDEDDAPHPDAD